MDKVKILIVEDEPLFATEIEMLVHRLGYQVAHSTNNAKDAIYMAKVMEPDLIIMDINIEGDLSGVDVAEKIRDLEIPILFVTSMQDPDLYERAKKTTYVGYLVKPFDLLTLQSSIEFTMQTLARKYANQERYSGWREDMLVKDSLLIKKDTSLIKLPISDIQYIQSYGNHCMLHTLDQAKHMVNISLTKVMDKLPDKSFLRIHKQFIIQLDCIENITLGGSEVVMGELRLPVGRTFKSKLLARFETLG